MLVFCQVSLAGSSQGSQLGEDKDSFSPLVLYTAPSSTIKVKQ